LPFPVEYFTGRVDLFHATDFVLPPTLPRTRTLLTVHDLSFVRTPEATAPSLKAYLDVVVPRSARRADHILADSMATKTDLQALYDLPEDKITVLLSGVDPRFRPLPFDMTMRTRYRLGERPYILSVGTVQPRKNYGRLIAAVARLRAQGHDVSLVIVGGKGWLDDPIYAALDAAGMRDHVHFTGFADEADLPMLYAGALCFAFPSLYEGFGLPVLEAMACGIPVMTSNLSSLPEVAGDAAILVDPHDLDALAEALGQLIENSELRARLIAAGLARAAQFSWEQSAAQLRAVYAALLA
jgi:glycosyltransferase involved in cell wall biosynthesis